MEAFLKHLTWKTVFVLVITSVHSNMCFVTWSLIWLCQMRDLYFSPTLTSCLSLIHDSMQCSALKCHPYIVKFGQIIMCAWEELQSSILWELRTLGMVTTFSCSSPMARWQKENPSQISVYPVKTVNCAYTAYDLDAPQGIKGHQMRKQAVFHCRDGFCWSAAHLPGCYLGLI